ncbi:MAG: DUF481 domain-containing protein [Deltaproteobacteria bacterium]|nr:DUF481 domain-containing protein [Deltaproteobacteria bacterium]
MSSTFVLAVLVSQLLAAEPAVSSAPVAEDPAARSLVAAERAAAAAEKAAEAAMKAAEAAREISERVGAASSAPAAALAAPQTETKPAEPPGALWSGTVALSLISLTGNARSITVNGAGAAERKSENWILGLKASGAYGQAKPLDSGDIATVALNAAFQARAAYRLTPRYSAYLVGGIDTDHVASIEERPYGEAGVGILWLDEMQGDLSRLRLNTDIAFRYGREIRQQYYPVSLQLDDETIAAPRVGLAFRYALNKDVIFTEDAEALPTVVGDARWLINSTTKIAARIVNPLSISLGFQVRYDSRPAPDKKDLDTALSFGVEAGF